MVLAQCKVKGDSYVKGKITSFFEVFNFVWI